MKPVSTLRRVVHNTDSTAKALWEISDVVATQSARIERELSALSDVMVANLAVQQAQARMLSAYLRRAAEKQGITLDAADLQVPDVSALVSGAGARNRAGDAFQRPPQQDGSFEQAMQNIPLLLAEKTYNTQHPHYDARLVRNDPGAIFNADSPCINPVYKSLLKMVKKEKNRVPPKMWDAMLEDIHQEAKTVPGYAQVMERKTYIEQTMKDLGAKYKAHYVAGWVNLEDALFLYWLVRQVKPRCIVQTGVCNGLSSSFMVLGLAKNGGEGKLHAVDLAAVFNPGEPDWKVAGKVYGVVIPEGKSSGWMVPDAHRDRFEVQNGDAKKLLPPLVDRVDGIDMFYHDSDHSYNHMMFEFREAKRKLRPGGLMVADDISWNPSLWDFADEYKVPAYNYKGAVGIAFF